MFWYCVVTHIYIYVYQYVCHYIYIVHVCKCLILYAIPVPLPKSAHRNDQDWFEVRCLDFSHCDPEEFISRKCVSHRPKLVQNVVGLACKKICVYVCVCETVYLRRCSLFVSFPLDFCTGLPVFVQWQMQLKRVGFDGEKMHRVQ